jgi:hypothetical protein
MQIARAGGLEVVDRAGFRIRGAVALALLALPAGLYACQSPTAPPAPPGGGQLLVLDFNEFQQNVEPVLVRQGCDATGDCHGGGIRGTYALSPPGAKDVSFDFQQSCLQVTIAPRESSAILRMPLALAAGGAPHPVKPFATTSDPDYQAILKWVLDGVVR